MTSYLRMSLWTWSGPPGCSNQADIKHGLVKPVAVGMDTNWPCNRLEVSTELPPSELGRRDDSDRPAQWILQACVLPAASTSQGYHGGYHVSAAPLSLVCGRTSSALETERYGTVACCHNPLSGGVCARPQAGTPILPPFDDDINL